MGGGWLLSTLTSDLFASRMLISLQPLDFSLLDRHFGDIDDWRAAVTEIHKRGMYVILDNTLST